MLESVTALTVRRLGDLGALMLIAFLVPAAFLPTVSAASGSHRPDWTACDRAASDPEHVVRLVIIRSMDTRILTWSVPAGSSLDSGWFERIAWQITVAEFRFHHRYRLVTPDAWLTR